MLSMQVPKSIRMQEWAALFVFSAVTLGAHQSNMNIKNTSTSPEKWVLSVTIISLVVCFLAVLSHLMEASKKIDFATKIEGGIALILLLFWSVGLVYIMDPDLNMAVTDTTFFGRPTILNPNLFFSSWISFALILIINGNLAEEFSNKELLSQTTVKTAKWYGLAACSVVMLASSIEFHRSFRCKDFSGTESCRRNAFAISLGVIGSLVAMVMSYLSSTGSLESLHGLIVSVISFIFFTFGVIFITFGTGPGTTIGNLYFSTWLAFIVTVTLVSAYSREYLEETQGAVAQEAPAPTIIMETAKTGPSSAPTADTEIKV